MTIAEDLPGKQRLVERLFAEQHEYPAGDLSHVVAQILEKRAAILKAVDEHPTPFYLFDRAGFDTALRGFAEAFNEHVPGHQPFYAVKSNHHPFVVAEAVRQGFGLDVSSGRELRQALEHPDCQILFSGPAKSADDLELALRHTDRVTIHIDSFRELERLGEVTARTGQSIRAGVRVFTDHHGAWTKFGIPLKELSRFWREAKKHPLVALQGVQFHLSWNRTAEPYRRILEDLGSYFQRELTAGERKQIRFVDIGGGYKPHRLEGYFPDAHPLGEVIRTAAEHYGEEPGFLRPYYVKESIPVSDYASAIGEAIDQHLRPWLDCAYFTEPGRIVSTFSMHIVLKVVDRKSDGLVIVDGGINMVGWEKFLSVYCPIVNLSRPSTKELEVRVGGSLCDCEDIWGTRVYGDGIEEGDLLVVPYQGAYTFCVAQNFIRPIPPVHELPA